MARISDEELRIRMGLLDEWTKGNYETVTVSVDWIGELVLDLQDARNELEQKKPSLRGYLQGLANKHSVIFKIRLNCIDFYLEGNCSYLINAEGFFNFDDKAFDKDICIGEEIAPDK